MEPGLAAFTTAVDAELSVGEAVVAACQAAVAARLTRHTSRDLQVRLGGGSACKLWQLLKAALAGGDSTRCTGAGGCPCGWEADPAEAPDALAHAHAVHVGSWAAPQFIWRGMLQVAAQAAPGRKSRDDFTLLRNSGPCTVSLTSRSSVSLTAR